MVCVIHRYGQEGEEAEACCFVTELGMTLRIEAGVKESWKDLQAA